MTGCPNSPIGKDDFFGYWRTTDFVDGQRIDYYENSEGVYQIDWDFDGVSEDMFKNGGTFKQHLRRATNPSNLENGILVNETFWTGRYELKGNSGYSAGSLVLYYEYGVQLKTYGGYNAISPDYSYNDVKNFSEADFLNIWKYGTKTPNQTPTGLAILSSDELQSGFTNNRDGSSGKYRNGIYVQTRYISGQTKKEYGDIEYFRYRLEDGVGFKGYARMLTTTLDKKGQKAIGGLYNQWYNKYDGSEPSSQEKAHDPKIGTHSSKYGYKNSSECSWAGTNYRALGSRDKKTDDWVSNDSRTNEQLFNITVSAEGKITAIDDSGDTDPTTDEQYSNIDR